MSDDEEFILEIYHEGAVITIPVYGERRFLLERGFLDDIIDQEFGPPYRDRNRPIGDPSRDFYQVNDEQFAAYLAFSKRIEREVG